MKFIRGNGAKSSLFLFLYCAGRRALSRRKRPFVQNGRRQPTGRTGRFPLLTQQLDLAQSIRYCDQIARTRARNFYYGFMLLPRERRRALSVVYSFFRACDDCSDEDGTIEARRELLDEWRGKLDSLFSDPSQASSLGPIFPALHHVIQRYAIPARYFYELLDGTGTDLEKSSYDTFDELYAYCYRVASTVGLVCLHIFGFDGSSEALKMAEWCGIAFQLTNILRDVDEDAHLGRVYLPEEDLRRFGLTAIDVATTSSADARFRQLMAFEAQRAHEYYDRAAPLLYRIDPASRAGFSAMVSIYRSLLRKIEQEDFRVHGRRIKLSKGEKLRLLVSSFLRRGDVLGGGGSWATPTASTCPHGVTRPPTPNP